MTDTLGAGAGRDKAMLGRLAIAHPGEGRATAKQEKRSGFGAARCHGASPRSEKRKMRFRQTARTPGLITAAFSALSLPALSDVILYEPCEYQGHAIRLTQGGDYGVNDLIALGMVDYDMSSIRRTR
jgi:hypothetical protein